MPPLHLFPTINATLNGCAALLLLIGFLLIKSGRRRAHGWVMGSAFGVSVLFLICYLYYHLTLHYVLHAGVTRFPPIPVWRTIYLGILLTHTVLAAVVAPLAITAEVHAAKRRWDRHRRVARWLWPIWMYVSVTGVVIYVMLYHIFKGAT